MVFGIKDDKYGIMNMGLGIWVLGYGIMDVVLGIWD
jgi:hypothetical protein